MSLAPWRCPHASRPDDARMSLAPRRCPHASRTPAIPACLSRPGDARMLRALAIPPRLKLELASAKGLTALPGDLRGTDVALSDWMRTTPRGQAQEDMEANHHEDEEVEDVHGD
ncbi:hypothetical protein VNO80_19315 [Phaseolus coccineus]|uniref:Uncharacterized protein n=1 Tax=Phaseolus coccineus TaxID=3886 RepID=A0AAN9MG76_PHACN